MAYNYKNKIAGTGHKYISRSAVVKKIISYVITVENTRQDLSNKRVNQLPPDEMVAKKHFPPSDKNACMRPEQKTNHER